MERQHWNTDSKYKQNQYNYQENHTYVSMQKKNTPIQLFHTIQKWKELVKTARDTLSQEQKLNRVHAAEATPVDTPVHRCQLAKASLLRPSTTQEDSS